MNLILEVINNYINEQIYHSFRKLKQYLGSKSLMKLYVVLLQLNLSIIISITQLNITFTENVKARSAKLRC